MDLSFGLIILIFVILTISAFAHGVLGFAYPLISMPILALFWDVKLAVITLIIPNLLINFICAMRGKKNFSFFLNQWPIFIFVLIGTLIGSQTFFYLNQTFLELLLATIILLFLLQEKIEHLAFLKRMNGSIAAGPIYALLAGFFSGTLNIGSVPLVIYYVMANLTPVVLGQLLNIMFGSSKLIQLTSLTINGQFQLVGFYFVLGISVVSVMALYAGFWLQNRVSLETQSILITNTLKTICVVLYAQVFIHLLMVYHAS